MFFDERVDMAAAEGRRRPMRRIEQMLFVGLPSGL
jgi:hypothetical protein